MAVSHSGLISSENWYHKHVCYFPSNTVRSKIISSIMGWNRWRVQGQLINDACGSVTLVLSHITTLLVTFRSSLNTKPKEDLHVFGPLQETSIIHTGQKAAVTSSVMNMDNDLRIGHRQDRAQWIIMTTDTFSTQTEPLNLLRLLRLLWTSTQDCRTTATACWGFAWF